MSTVTAATTLEEQPPPVSSPLPWWRSTLGEPPWVRVCLVLVAAAAAVLYSWNVSRMQLHLYYGPAVRSMSSSWEAFLYGTYDPAATLTMDKLPGVFWLQALSARVFGFEPWSVLLPQLLASVATVLLLHRVVSRVFGPVAGLLAAAAYASTPMVAALARTQVPDVLLVLLTVLAVGAWQRAISTGRLPPLLMCGVWIGLAFQAKMVHAWAAWLPFAVTYLAMAVIPLRRRVWQLAAAGAVTLSLSLVWVVVMLAIPASSRPYIDGSTDNSPISMVFGYNAFQRYGVDNPGSEVLGIGGPVGNRSESPWLYMFGEGVAPQVGWLYPLALLGLVCGLLWAGRPPGSDRSSPAPEQVSVVRANYLMWGLWLLTQSVAFAASVRANSFYLLNVAPPVAALSGAGAVLLWSAHREDGWRRWLLPAGLATTAGWAAYTAGRFPDFYPWLVPALLVGALLAILTLAVAPLAGRVEGRLVPRRLAVVGGLIGVAAVLLAPAAWATSVSDNLGVVDAHRPAAGPTSREVRTVLQGRLPRLLPASESQRLTAYLAENARLERYTVAVQWAPQSGPFIHAGLTPLPVGGFTAQVPNVTPERLAGLVARGELRYAMVDGPAAEGMVTPDYPDYGVWVRDHCTPVPGFATPLYTLYDCRTGTTR